jgi:hypothetical protein
VPRVLEPAREQIGRGTDDDRRVAANAVGVRLRDLLRGIRLVTASQGGHRSRAYIVVMPLLSPHLAQLPNRELVEVVSSLAAAERHATTALIEALAELDARRLYLEEGCSSLFTFCTEQLHLSESAAYHRITAARTARRFPVILDCLRDGELTMTTISLLAPHLSEENWGRLVEAARYRSKREVEELVAAMHPRPDVPTSVRKLPAPRAAALQTPPASLELAVADAGGEAANQAEPDAPQPARSPKPAVVRPLAPARYQIQVTVSADTHEKLRRAQALLRHAIPDGDPAAVIDRALTLLVEHLERTRCAATRHSASHAGAEYPRTTGAKSAPATDDTDAASRPASKQVPHSARGRSRTIPNAMKREVWMRDGGQCAYMGRAGRCSERGGLEFHHIVPFADGGASTSANLALACRAHNRHEAARWFGDEVLPSTSSGGSWRAPAAPQCSNQPAYPGKGAPGEPGERRAVKDSVGPEVRPPSIHDRPDG